MILVESMDMEFRSIDELYNRIKPALYSKLKEIHNLGFTIVSEKDIWNYLIINTWTNKKNLELHELISDILYVDNYKVYNYVMDNLSKYKKENEEIIVDKDSLF